MPSRRPLPRWIRRILREFASYPDVTPTQVAVLESAIAGSRRLVHAMSASIRAGQLLRLTPLPAQSHAGGTYDGESKIISIPVRILDPATRSEMIFVLGHELQHALDNPAMGKAEEQFFAAAEMATRTDYDYTPAIREYLGYQRTNEARANLAGWNALADYIRDTRPDATLAHLVMMSWRTEDFVTTALGPDLYALRQGLTINPDMSFDLTPTNVEAMGRYYFDKDPAHTGIGYLGTSDYLNQYAADAVSQAAACHRYFNQGYRPQPIMIINASELGLSRKIMEENGIDLAGQPMQPYLDRSTTPPQLDYLHHTIQTHQYVPVDHEPPPRPAPDPSVGVARRTFALPAASIPTIPADSSTPRRPDRNRSPRRHRHPRTPRAL